MTGSIRISAILHEDFDVARDANGDFEALARQHGAILSTCADTLQSVSRRGKGVLRDAAELAREESAHEGLPFQSFSVARAAAETLMNVGDAARRHFVFEAPEPAARRLILGLSAYKTENPNVIERIITPEGWN